MKKFFSFFAALLFAGSMMAAPYTLTFNYFDNTGSDKNAAETELSGLFDEASMAYLSADGAVLENVYLGRKYKDKVTGDSIFSNVKFGSSSKAGKLTFALKNMAVDSVIFKAAMYGDAEGGDGFSVNGTAFTLSAGNKVFENVKYVPAGDITALEVVQTKASKGRFYLTSITVYPKEGGVTPPATLTEPAAAPDAPTVPANQVKAVYSATYNADCGFGEWGSGTVYTQETVGKKYVTTNLGYFGLTFEGDAALNCSKMEKLHIDIWIAENASVGIVPIHGGAEVRVTKDLVGQQWNSFDIALSEFANENDWSNTYQIKLDEIREKTFWVNNVYFYTTVAPAADTEAPQNVTASLVSASYFSAKISATATDNSDAVKFVVMDGEKELAAANAVSGVAKEIVVAGLLPNTAYNFSVIAKDEAGNAAAPVAVAATTLAAPAPATAPTYAADKVLGVQTDAYNNIAYGIQDWWSMPATTIGNLTATSKALCIEPTSATPAGACFGLAFAATDITAYDALEMDVYPTVEGAKLKIQVIGVGDAASEYTLVAGQWNHIVLNIKDNTKNNCEQIGFYDCHNILGACFIQNVLFVDTDAPVVTGPTNCAEAAEAALSVANNNDLYNDGAVYSITGYVTSIQTAYNSQYNNVSFWMADAADGGNVIEAYRAACASAEDAPIVGDKVTVTGSLTKYNTTPEFAAGCTYVIVEHATPVVPQNLGEKTIAEFLALANTVDTCVITGVVANIKKNNDGSYNKYGNFDLVDGEASVYVYGLLTAAGEAQKFQEMGIDEKDTLTVKAVYSLYNNNVQAKNAVFVAVKKAAVEPGVEIDITVNSNTTPEALMWIDAVATEGWWQIYGAAVGADANCEFSISNISTTEVAGVYTIDDLDADYTYITKMTETDTIDVAFVDGSVTVAVSAEGVVTVVGTLVGDDGNTYNFNLTYVDPTAKNVVNVTISEGALYDVYASYGLYGVYGYADDNTAYVQLGIWVDEEFAGEFTYDDLDFRYVGSLIEDAAGSHNIFSAAITVYAGENEGDYAVLADILCYNNTLYKVVMTIGNGAPEGVENVDAAVKAIKRLVNGNVVIEKAGKKFTVNGAQL